MERSLRIARITALLNRPQGVTMAALIEDLESSRATINRDLELLRSQMNAPIIWDRETYSYRLDHSPTAGNRQMLPGIWLTPEQAYAYLTLNNMVEKLAPSLLGPFLEPMRGMLKDILCRADFDLYALHHKIEIQNTKLPALSDHIFQAIFHALIHDEGVEILYTPNPLADPIVVQCVISRIRLLRNRWQLVLRISPDEVIAINAATVLQIKALNPQQEA